MTAVTSKKRGGRVSFADETFTSSTSLATLPPTEPAPPTSARVDDMVANPHNPRDGYTGQSLDELAASMAEVGQLQPLAVVSREVWLAHFPGEAAAVDQARWVVLTGCRRLAAAPAAGFERLDITVKDRLAGEDPRLSEATLVENLHREALPPLQEARELLGLVERHGSQTTAAKRIGKTQGWVSQRLSLLKLTPELQERLVAGDLTIETARKLTSIAADEQLAHLERLQGGDIVGESSPRHDESPAPGPARRGRKPSPPDVDRIAQDLRKRLSDEERARLVALLVGD